MSTETRSFILRQMRDIEVLHDTLAKMNVTYTENAKMISVSNGVTLNITAAGVLAQFEEPHYGQVPEKNRFVKEIQDVYAVTLKEKIERVRREIAEQNETGVLERINQEKSAREQENEEKLLEIIRQREIEKKRELSRLETTLRAEERALREKIEEEVRLIAERGKVYGFNVEVSQNGGERVILLSRLA